MERLTRIAETGTGLGGEIWQEIDIQVFVTVVGSMSRQDMDILKDIMEDGASNV